MFTYIFKPKYSFHAHKFQIVRISLNVDTNKRNGNKGQENWRCHIWVRARGGARDTKLEQFKQ